MKLELLCFRYFTLDDLEDIKNQLLKGFPKEKSEINSFFEEILKREEDWEGEELPESTNPEADDDYDSIENLKSILGGEFQYFEKTVVHLIKVRKNPFGFERILVFQNKIIQKDIGEEAIEDRLRASMLTDFKKIDDYFVPKKKKEKGLEKINPNLWVIIGDSELTKKGIWEKPNKVAIKEKDAGIEKSFSLIDAYYVIYAKEEDYIKNLELIDLAFLLIVPFRKSYLYEQFGHWEGKLDKWREEINKQIQDFQNKQGTKEQKQLIGEIVNKMGGYFNHEKQIEGEIIKEPLTLESRTNKAYQAPEGQLHKIVAKDMKEDLKELVERAQKIKENFKDTFLRLNELFNISSQSMQTDLTLNIQKILRGANIITIIIVILTIVQIINVFFPNLPTYLKTYAFASLGGLGIVIFSSKLAKK